MLLASMRSMRCSSITLTDAGTSVVACSTRVAMIETSGSRAGVADAGAGADAGSARGADIGLQASTATAKRLFFPCLFSTASSLPSRRYGFFGWLRSLRAELAVCLDDNHSHLE